MSHRYLAAVVVATLLSLSTTAPVMASASPAPEPSGPGAWLKGAFGRVGGGTPAEPATAAPDERPLDTWMRSAPLELTTERSEDDPLGVTVVARSLDGGDEVVLSSGATAFEGPDTPGRHLLVATLESSGAPDSRHAWLLEVPDRAGSPELLWEIPGVSAILGSTAGEVAGSPGHGCYAYLCVEAGYRPPTEQLEPLVIEVGETPVLRLDDGSAMAGWRGFLEYADAPGERVLETEGTFDDGPQAIAAMTGLGPAAEGEWLLEVRVDYDRERGWQWFLFRLVAG